MWRKITSWGVIGPVFAVLVTIGGGVLSMTPPQFGVAQSCFSLAALILFGRILYWLTMELLLRGWRLAINIVIFLVVVGFLWFVSVDWVNKTQNEWNFQHPIIQTSRPKQLTAGEIAEELAKKLHSSLKPKSIQLNSKIQSKPLEKPAQPSDRPITDRPYITLNGPDIVKDTSGANYVIRFKLINASKRSATHLQHRHIFVDQNFREKPTIADGSSSNDFIVDTWFFNDTKGIFPSMKNPSYLVFAIKYEDSEAMNPKTFYQVWYFKQTGVTNNDPPEYGQASIQETKDILNHLKEELKDYICNEHTETKR